MKKKLLFLYLLPLVFAEPLFAAYESVTVPFRYMAWPLARIRKGSSPTYDQLAAQEEIPLFYSDTQKLGSTEEKLSFGIPYAEFLAILQNPPPTLDSKDEEIVRKCLSFFSKVDHTQDLSEQGVLHVNMLSQVLGPTRTAYVMLALSHHLPNDTVLSIAGVDPQHVEKSGTLAYRRFGVIRRRGPRQDISDKMKISTTPLHPDPFHMIVSDQVTPLIQDVLPPPAQFYPGYRMAEFFSLSDPSLTIPWGHDSASMHALVHKALTSAFKKGNRTAIDETLLSGLTESAKKLNLERLYFFIVEEFQSEDPLYTMALIDGGSKDHDYYKTPIEERFHNIDFRALFPGEIMEGHGLAIDPDIVEKLGSRKVNIDTMLLLLASHIKDSSLEGTTFVLQTDNVAARAYRRYGFEIIPQENNPYGDKHVVMFATGKTIKEKVMGLNPNAVRAFLPELPNHLNRRMATPINDATCRKLLRSFGYE